MTAAAIGLSHSPLIGKNDPEPEVLRRVDQAVAGARAFIQDFEPELVVLYAPDHYNGFFYREMPPFCLATEAHAVGDFGSGAGPRRSTPRRRRPWPKGCSTGVWT
jgi:2,3-dihydroxyphenylpropionate 1,2-dioxygenase